MKNNSRKLPGTVQKATPNLKGFDTDTVVSASQANYFKRIGYSFCIRYLSLANGQQSGDLSFNEANDILKEGLALSAVQHVDSAGWTPTKSLGTIYGKNAASNAISVGLPLGMNLWCDLEGIATGTLSQNVIDYCNAWYSAVQKGGYIPGIYVGANSILSGSQLYEDLEFQHYWKSSSSVPAISNRGYQLVQSLENKNSDNLRIDTDTTQNDELGDSMVWLMI
ncbi:DUF1906 domain-containing protein [Flavobacterium sp. ZT3R18]|uniref:DUF1906 domain-containing protein n=1 Tax=Flavobacterium sp. ZT3R18 TaxID=2594429 RepID=UPI001179F19D|nr:DUF1906 domain-containing protein [Flavobacterium sp. ZT3R18]TRX35529.1 DUF1906 domain-containing protein [Flavobacterium sp. ZT3R18]